RTFRVSLRSPREPPWNENRAANFTRDRGTNGTRRASSSVRVNTRCALRSAQVPCRVSATRRRIQREGMEPSPARGKPVEALLRLRDWQACPDRGMCDARPVGPYREPVSPMLPRSLTRVTVARLHGSFQPRMRAHRSRNEHCTLGGVTAHQGAERRSHESDRYDRLTRESLSGC